ncbi:hypothetical protein [uncultured Acetatifactor sp.]|jgi:hypothetical protein|uniref:hypothetical protein n=1 Tax=uncultured Acetatifactor sp. TaxID=1671927 RepID=UPI002625484A|nr:hypothetical protein [uncultured Acetatifactor sp.]MCI9571636.1 hypothetical protein [Lachnospiraceae bacterium]
MRRQTGPWRRVTKFVPYILIGMDILKDFDFRCGESEWNGEYLFLGCLKENINSDYLNELHKYFGYISPLRTDIILEWFWDNPRHGACRGFFRLSAISLYNCPPWYV